MTATDTPMVRYTHTIFPSYAEANTTIYYHNQEALGRMIANLVKVIGEDELIRRTGGSNACIKFVQQPNCGDKYD